MFLIGIILAGFLLWEASQIEVDPRVRDNKRWLDEADRRLTELERRVAAWKEMDDVV